MKKNTEALRAVIEIQVDATGDLALIEAELRTVVAQLKIGSQTASGIENFRGYKFRVEKVAQDADGFPQESYS